MAEKNLTVRYFARFRDTAGCAEESVSLDVATTGDLFAALAHKLSADEPLSHCKVAINDELVDWSAPLTDGDVVLMFPPVAGG